MNSQNPITDYPLPAHISIIMDGNGRWAQKQGKNRVVGHQNGVTSVREVVEGCSELGIGYLTLYAFSTENWKRPKYEVDALMELLVKTIHQEVDKLIKNKVRLSVIGDRAALPATCQVELKEAEVKTAQCDRLNLILALSYSSQWEIINAVKAVAMAVEQGQLKAADVDGNTFEQYLCTGGIPDPELMIRTGGEHRISNFLLYQSAYTELYFTDKHWPDFRKEDLFAAIADFQHRERRFGKTGDQVKQEKK